MGKMSFPQNEQELSRLISQYNAIHKTDLRWVSKQIEDSIIDRLVEERVSGIRQMIADCCQMALHDAFGFAAARLHRFMLAFAERWDWMCKLVEEDYKSPAVPSEKKRDWYLYSKGSDFCLTVPLLLNTQKKVDGELRKICGEHFVPWAVRYGDEAYRED